MWATARAEAVGVSPAHVLLTWAKVNRLELWGAQRELWGNDWVDVRDQRPDAVLARSAGLERCLANGFVPHHIDGADGEVLVLDAPTSVNGIAQQPIEGTSFLSSLHDAAVPHAKQVQYFEMFGHRGLWQGGWKAVAIGSLRDRKAAVDLAHFQRFPGQWEAQGSQGPSRCTPKSTWPRATAACGCCADCYASRSTSWPTAAPR